jgi:predicted PurR-regulated permease PerM
MDDPSPPFPASRGAQGPSAPGPLRVVSAPGVLRASAGGFLSLLALIVFLQWAQGALIPITLAVLLSYALAPVVELLRVRARLPKLVGAAVTLVALLGVTGAGLTLLRPDAMDIISVVPRAAQKINSAMRTDAHAPAGAFAILDAAIREVEKIANSHSGPALTTSVTAGFRVRDYLLVGTLGVVDAIGQAVVVISLTYFLLIAGDTFRRALVEVRGGAISERKNTIRMLDEINQQIQRYLLVQLASAALFGLVAWGILAGLGLERAATWACIGGLLHLVPYAGPAAFVCLVALVGYVQFDTLGPVFTILGCLAGCLALISLLLVPLLTQRMGSLNAVAVFLALLAWGWLWGVWGLLLGVPIMMALNTVCERIVELQAVSAFLGQGSKTPGRA